MLAAIDIGSLTVRLLIGDVCAGRLVPHLYQRAVTGLGSGLRNNRGLLPDARERTLAALSAFAAEMGRRKIDNRIVLGTESLRRGANAGAFLAEIRSRCGLRVEIIDGDREATLSARGVMAALRPEPCRSLIVDIGGGSTEFVLHDEGSIVWRASQPLGVVRLADEPAMSRSELVRSALWSVRQSLQSAGLLSRVMEESCVLVGTAGTVTTLAAIELQMTRYDGRLINNMVLDRPTIHRLCRRLCDVPVASLQGLAGLESEREKYIGCGAAIVQTLLEVFKKDYLKISDYGLLEGALLELSESLAH